MTLLLTTLGTWLGTAARAAADPARASQWQLKELNASTAWRHASGAGVVVAVLDSGVDATHQDLAGRVLPGIDLVDEASDGRTDPIGHGTTVAALIAGRAKDSGGVTGLAPDAKILPVRVLDARNRYNDATVVADGLRWAVDNGASVVNMSLGGTTRSTALARAVEYATSHDVVVVACTGNQDADATGSTEVWYPAREPGVLAVAGLAGATPAPARDRTGGGAVSGPAGGGGAGVGQETLWSGSITGPETVLTAPAVNMLGARPGGYWRVQGTSFAAPLVAASAALVRSRWPRLNAATVIKRLISTARDLGPAGRDDRYGFGEVNPAGALTVAVPDVNHNPLLDQGAQPGATTRAAARPGPRAIANYLEPPPGWIGSDLALLLALLLVVAASGIAVTRSLRCIAGYWSPRSRSTRPSPPAPPRPR